MITLKSLTIRVGLIILTFLCIASSSFAQKVVRMDPYEIKYETGVVLVKFEEELNVPLNSERRLGKVALTGIQEILAKYGIEQGERLFPQAKREVKLGKMRSFSGEEIAVESLYNIFKLEFDPLQDARVVAEELAKQDGVVYAEPDYIFSALETVPNDALYSQQWYLPVVNAPAAWDTTTGDTTQIIAIIDTGVDWDHADLDNKMKINWIEYNGATGVDDDTNGKVDDIRGWDFINNDNDPNDDNSHGTHVAGIAAAETDNSTGVAGVSWGAKILPVKVMQSSGYGSSSVIAQGVDYAAARGATIINLSLGSYSESLTLKTALENAYSNAVIVAAAGNDKEPITRNPMYPACYGFVLGVEATKQTWDEIYGWRAPFSNFDPDGPVESNNGYNYEIKAPGVSVYSTFPNGNYHFLNGTSMATPVVAGTVALMKSYNPTQTTEQIFARLIHGVNANGFLDIANTIDYTLEPDLYYVDFTLIDTLPGCDDDGIADAGETIELYLTVKNVGGYADSVWSKFRLGEFEDESVADIVDSTCTFGEISAYATLTGELEPFKIHIDPDVANNRDVVFEYEIGCKNSVHTVKGNIITKIINGTELIGVMDTTLVLTPDRLWITSSSFRVAGSGLLKILPGTHLKLYNNIDLKGRIEGFGKPDSLIDIEGPAVIKGDGELELEYTNLHGMSYGPFADSWSYNGPYIFKYCFFSDINFANHDPLFELKNITIENCDIRNSNFGKMFYSFPGGSIVVSKTNVSNSHLWQQIEKGIHTYNNFVNIECSYIFDLRSSSGYPSLINNNLISTFGVGYNSYICRTSTDSDVLDVPNNYWGSLETDIIDQKIYDFWDYSTLALLDYDPILTAPTDSAHGVVWKVEINSVDPQDEQLDPIGLEILKFDVYFNRAMDTTYTTILSFGVREPFNQNFVNDNASWSTDSTIWTAYHTIGIETGDGINTIRVSDAKDPEGFEIPIEDQRFQFVIQAAGSAANQFIATVGVGKVDLEWPTAPSDDALGYNMYRIMQLTDNTFTDTTRINMALVTDTTYIDFDVIPDSTYRYMYKVLGTDMAESDYSKSVSATPVNAAGGDANGDLSVDVLDIVAIVNYILEENPQPFLLEAADVNSDGEVNVLDIVGVVNLILGTPKRLAEEFAIDPASLTLTSEGVLLNSSVPVYAMQFTLTGKEMEQCLLKPTEVLNGFEIAKRETSEWIKIVLYNFNGLIVPEGENLLFDIQGGKDLEITNSILVDRNGGLIPTSVEGEGAVIPDRFALYPNYPNPFNPATKIRFALPKSVQVKLVIYNILGQRVKSFDVKKMVAGIHEVLWDGKNDKGIKVGSGVYLYRIDAGEFVDTKKMILLK